MSNLLKKKNEDEKSMTITLKTCQKKIEKLLKQNDEVRKTFFTITLNDRNPLRYYSFNVFIAIT